jgi:hypothetical protein
MSGYFVLRLDDGLDETFHYDEVHAHCFARSTQKEEAKLQVSDNKAFKKVLHLGLTI